MQYEIRRRKRKTLCLTVDAHGNAAVLAPYSASLQEIETFVGRHKVWLARRIKERSVQISLDNGSKFPFMGKEVTVYSGAARLEGDALYLPEKNRREALFRLCKALALSRMEKLTEVLALEYGFRYERVRISSARTRWGSCSKKGSISYSLFTQFLPEELARYIAVHELCHTRRFDHSAAFWAEVRAILPDYARRKRLLREYRWAMSL